MSNKKMLFFFAGNPFFKKGGDATRAFSCIKIFKELGFEIDLVGVQDVYRERGDDEIIDKRYINDFFLIESFSAQKNNQTKKYTFPGIFLKLFSKKNTAPSPKYFRFFLTNL